MQCHCQNWRVSLSRDRKCSLKPVGVLSMIKLSLAELSRLVFATNLSIDSYYALKRHISFFDLATTIGKSCMSKPGSG